MSKYIAHNIITNMRYKPRKRETVLLGKKLDVPIKKILEITGYSERQMYRIIKEDIYEHLRFAPAFEEEHYLLMNEIFTAVDKFKELLI